MTVPTRLLDLIYFQSDQQDAFLDKNFMDADVLLWVCAHRRALEPGAHAGLSKLALQQEGFAGDVCLAR